MNLRTAAWHTLQRLRRPSAVPVWHDPAYRLPLSRLEPREGIELRRADLVAWHLQRRRALRPDALRAPVRVRWTDLARVHTPAYLESLADPAVLARIFAVDHTEVNADALLESLRLACGATLAAAHEALDRHGPAVNLLGGFHHAFPDRGGGFCAWNDVAVAIAALRAEGFTGQVAVIDLDAHPPDGTAACVAGDAATWLGSISGSDWGPLAETAGGAFETVLPAGTGDGDYLAVLDELLRRMPRPQLAFVLAGGDVLAGDALGRLGLSERGVRERDRRVARRLEGVASVWLPGGGYGPHAWRLLAGTVLVLAGRADEAIPATVDPLEERFDFVARRLRPEKLRGARKTGGPWDISFEPGDLDDIMGVAPPREPRLLGFYSKSGIEYALHAYGILEHIERLGYADLRVAVAPAISGGDQVRLTGRAGGAEHLLMETTLEKKWLAPPVEADMLYIHWLTLRDPRARFRRGRAPLPGQDAPGLGLARETTLMLERVARRLDLAGLAYRPAWFHTAYPARHLCVFAEPARQGRFEAMLRDFAALGLSLADGSRALAEGRVRRNGEPYAWEADVMVRWLDGERAQAGAAEIAAERDRVSFTVDARGGREPGTTTSPAPRP